MMAPQLPVIDFIDITRRMNSLQHGAYQARWHQTVTATISVTDQLFRYLDNGLSLFSEAGGIGEVSHREASFVTPSLGYWVH